jgi:hypothetical protein
MLDNLLIDDYIPNVKYIITACAVIYLLLAISVSIIKTNKTISSTIRSKAIISINKIF